MSITQRLKRLERLVCGRRSASSTIMQTGVFWEMLAGVEADYRPEEIAEWNAMCHEVNAAADETYGPVGPDGERTGGVIERAINAPLFMPESNEPL